MKIKNGPLFFLAVVNIVAGTVWFSGFSVLNYLVALWCLHSAVKWDDGNQKQQ